MNLQDRYLGCLLGLACGDAVGTTVEFSPRGSFAPLTGMVGGGPFSLQAGQWTDDTSMALCLAASLVECNDFDARDQMERYVRWLEEGYYSSTGRCFDIGATTSQALHRYQRTGDPFSGSADPYAAAPLDHAPGACPPCSSTRTVTAAMHYAAQSQHHPRRSRMPRCLPPLGCHPACRPRRKEKEQALFAQAGRIPEDAPLSPKIQ